MSRILIVDSGTWPIGITRLAEHLREQGHVVLREDLTNQEETPMFMSDAMKFGKFARLLGALLSSEVGLPIGNRSGRRGVRLPTGAALRNPTDPLQAERIEKAAEKRLRKAQKLKSDSMKSTAGNWAHIQSSTYHHPFYR